MITSILLVSLIGLGISLYLYALEEKVKRAPNYKPFCDISDSISCTKVMKSGYNIFSVSNALIGAFFYGVMAVLALLNAHSLILIAAIIGCIVSCILAYILFFKIKSLCILCFMLYAINFFLLYLSWGSI